MSLEDRRETEEMRHVPPLDFIARRVEHEYGRRLGVLAEVLDRSDESDARAEARRCFDEACRWLLRTAECASRHKIALPPAENAVQTARRVVAAASEELRKVDGATFRRRMPYHTFERSEGEQVYAAFTAVPYYILRCGELLATLDPGIHERLLAYQLEPGSAVPPNPAAMA